ncbi:hypothetical protein JHK84_054287 [Glycine max]|nr:hypothetical protein JHK85_055225 [Glycine max]KAG5084249.1 hypothetical protein JHK84_054287 [Glycine max]
MLLAKRGKTPTIITMGGKNRQMKSSFLSVFNIFKSNKQQRGGSNYNTYYDEGPKVSGTKTWPSDEDKGRWGVADPVIDMRATAYIAQYKKRVSESEIHCQAQSQH